jgi:hypothetical protein
VKTVLKTIAKICKSQWIGLGENLQESPILMGKSIGNPLKVQICSALSTSSAVSTGLPGNPPIQDFFSFQWNLGIPHRICSRSASPNEPLITTVQSSG